MQCPSCNYINGATQVRCLQCSSILIHDAVGHSAEYKKGMHALDGRMYGGIGAVVGFVLVAALVKAASQDFTPGDHEALGFGSLGAVAGGIVGRLVASAKNKTLE